MRYWLEVTSAAGVRTGRIDNVLYWRWTPRLDKAGDIEFAIPATNPKRNLLANKVRVTCYAVIQSAVTEVGAGIVEEMAVQWTPQGGQVLTVRGADLLRELAIHRTIYGAGGTFVEYSNTFLVPDLLISLAVPPALPATWSLGGESSTDTAVYLRIWHDSILNGLIQVASVTGEHFRLDSGRTLTWLGAVANFADSNILATTHGDPVAIEGNPNACLITNITEIRDSWDQWTSLYVYGAGEGENRLDLRSVENWPAGLIDFYSGNSAMTFSSDLAASTGGTWNCHRAESYIRNPIAATAYGNLSRAIIYKNIAPLSNTDADLADAADQLLRAGYHYLRTHIAPQRFYRLTVTALDTLINVGETIRVMARGVYQDEAGRRAWLEINEDLIVLEVQNEINAAGVRTMGLTVSTTDRWPESDQSAIIEPLVQVSAALSLPQYSTIVDTVSHRADVDPGHSATLRFWLGPEVAEVNQVILRFRIDPMRSSGIDSDDLGDVAHSHTWPIYEEAITTSIGLSILGRIARGGSGGAVSNNIATSAGGYHKHPAHIGIEEESAGNTYAEGDLDVTINGGTPTNSITNEGDGWYSLDLTDDVADVYRRPTQVKNDVVLTDGRSGVAISSISKSVITVTVVTSAPHGLSNGDNVWIVGTSAYNGHHANVTVSDVYTFTFVAFGGAGSESTGTVYKYLSSRIEAQIERRVSIQSLRTV